MPLDIVVGTQWGDEGKGRVVDLLAAGAAIVARCAGGDNAGHTVSVGGQVLKLHLIPSGILHPDTLCLLGAGMAVNPLRLLEEIDRLAGLGLDVSPARLRLSAAAHLITPAHLALDGAEETRRGGGGLGTTRRGIGPAYTDKAARRGLRAGALRDPQGFADLVAAHVHAAAEALGLPSGTPGLDPRAAAAAHRAAAERLAPYLADIGALAAQALAQGQTVLAEGAQGTLLDLDHGTYPFVTSSHPTAAGALLGLGIGARHVRDVVGVTKAFQTRVGGGPFPTEVEGPQAERLRGSGANPWDEFGTTTGRPRRCGWLDGVLLRYAARVNGLTALALTKLDVLTGIDPIPLCTAYTFGGARHTHPPLGLEDLAAAAPEYEDLAGWDADVRGLRAWGDLPAAARAYVEACQDLVGVPVRWISVGPEREQVILREAAA